MGCGSSSASGEDGRSHSPEVPAQSSASPTPVAPTVVKPSFDMRSIHSAIRWNKPLNEVRALVINQEAANALDPDNGNRPIHIAAQNGHLEIVKLLIEKGADLDTKNLKGNTAIHMAIAYDYYDVAKALEAAGANKNLPNDAGHPACRGLEGDKTFALAALISATEIGQVEAAFALCKQETSLIDKAAFVKAGLGAKKTFASAWTPAHQNTFKEVMGQLA